MDKGEGRRGNNFYGDPEKGQAGVKGGGRDKGARDGWIEVEVLHCFA